MRKRHYIDTIYYDLELTSNIMRNLGSQLFKQLEMDITPVEHAALDTIFCNSDICQRDLAKLIFKDRANTGRILDSLESKGLITRFVDTKNNRLVRKMGITSKGCRKLREIHKKVEAYSEEIGANFSVDEIDQLQASLRKFR